MLVGMPLPSGGELLSFPVATRPTWVTGVGVREEKTTWINCAIFGRRVCGARAPHHQGSFVLGGELTVKRRRPRMAFANIGPSPSMASNLGAPDRVGVLQIQLRSQAPSQD